MYCMTKGGEEEGNYLCEPQGPSVVSNLCFLQAQSCLSVPALRPFCRLEINNKKKEGSLVVP